MQHATRCCSLALPALSQARYRWRRANTCRSALRRTRSKPILRRERHELATDPQAEEDELTGIYVEAVLGTGTRSHGGSATNGQGALAAHARDELGLTDELAARPLQAALASAVTFAVGAGVPWSDDSRGASDHVGAACRRRFRSCVW